MNCCCSCTCCFVWCIFWGRVAYRVMLILSFWQGCIFHLLQHAFFHGFSLLSRRNACCKMHEKRHWEQLLLLHLITILHTSMHRWSFVILTKGNKIRKQNRKCIKDNSLKACPSSKLLWSLNGTQQYTPLPSLNKTERISNHTSAELSYLTAGMVWARNKHQVKHIS